MPDAERFSFLEPEWFDELDSTSDEIRRRLDAGGARPGTVIATRLQTRGKGRLGRSWHSGAGLGLTFSFLWEGGIALESAATLPMACALAVGDLLARHGVDSRCKWPNDIMAGDAKICGILAESLAAAPGSVRLVMGIGLNLANDPNRDGLVDQPVAAMSDFTGEGYDPVLLLPGMLEALSVRIGQWTAGGFAGVRGDLRARLWGLGREARVRTGKNGADRTTGRIEGLGDRGELILLGDDGRPFPVVSVSALDF